MTESSDDQNVFLLQIGRNVRRLRQQRGLSQAVLAERTGVHRSYISEVETGARNFSILLLPRLSLALNAAPAELLYDLSETAA
jgi:transcriptional regulator with XRE-family HTH domain